MSLDLSATRFGRATSRNEPPLPHPLLPPASPVNVIYLVVLGNQEMFISLLARSSYHNYFLCACFHKAFSLIEVPPHTFLHLNKATEGA